MKGDALASVQKSAVFYPAKNNEPKVVDNRVDMSEEAVAARAAEALADRQKELVERAIRNEQAFAQALAAGKKVKPIGDKVICYQIPESESMLFEPDIAARKPLACVVISISDRPSDAYAAAALESIHVGDAVTILSQTGTEVVIDGTPAIALHIHDCLFRVL
jgi:co-chaperonin GroES (HSP10)